VRGRRQVTEQLAATKEGAYQLEVIGMGAALVRVVEQPGVTVCHAGAWVSRRAALPRHLRRGAHRERHGPDKHREARFALHQRIARDGVIEPMAGVMGLGNDGIEGAAVQRGVHLVGDLFQTPFKDGQGHRVHRRTGRKFNHYVASLPNRIRS
jgi:hypothetical protein